MEARKGAPEAAFNVLVHMNVLHMLPTLLLLSGLRHCELTAANFHTFTRGVYLREHSYKYVYISTV